MPRSKNSLLFTGRKFYTSETEVTLHGYQKQSPNEVGLMNGHQGRDQQNKNLVGHPGKNWPAWELKCASYTSQNSQSRITEFRV